MCHCLGVSWFFCQMYESIGEKRDGVLKIRKSGIFIEQGKACVYIMSTFARANGVIIISNVRNTR